MKYREISNTGIKVSEISLGCWTLGGLNWVEGVPNGWAEVDEKDIVEAVEHALENGVTHFDNADVYGNGRAERMLARVLGERINDVVVATKVGWFPGTAEHAFHPFHIRRQCEQSLINLKREHIDLYYFHHANFGENDEYLDDAVAEMNKLKDEGKIRAIGQSAYSHEDFVKLVPKVKPDALQSWASALDDRFLDESHPTGKLLKENNIGFFAFRPVEKGLLLHKYKAANPPTFEDGDHRKNNKWFTKESLEKLEAKLAKAEERFGDSTEDLVRMALQYLLHYETITAVIPGFRNLSQVKSNLTAADKPLTDEDFAFVKELFADWE